MPEQSATVMQPERDRWLRVKEILATALETPASGRASLLDRTCGGDADLRAEIEALIAFSDDEESGFIDKPAIAQGIALIDLNDAETLIGRDLGQYRIVEYIGEGGTGAVYRAVADDIGYERSVAVKILKRGMNSAAILRRFRDETRILARLDHPNIARFHEAGLAEEGRPYFVMEFLQGTPLPQYCAENGLGVRERIDLFLRVCSAVDYSHRNLIIHRDLKASNVLVTAAGIPKLLDFGIAKLLDRGVAGPELEQTAPLDQMMTPDYASPEQILGETITTAADVYSLGVLLYELLAERRPRHLAGLPIGEMARVIQTSEIQRPSTIAPVERRAELTGDVDVILLKALHSTPDRRYASPENFADDLRRHLEGRPVLARPDSSAYRAAKFVSRNRIGVLVSGIGTIALLAGGAVSLWQSATASMREEQARRRFADVRELATGLLGDLDASLESLPGATGAREILARRVLRYLDNLSRDRLNDAGLERELAVAYDRLGDILGGSRASNLGDSGGALDCYRKSLAILERLSAREPGNFAALRDSARAHTKLSDILALTGEQQQALEEDRKALAIYNAWLIANPSDPAARRAVATGLQELAGDLDRVGRFEEALENRRRVLSIFEELNANAPRPDQALRMQLALAYKRLGRSLMRVRRARQAVTMFETAIEIEREQRKSTPLSTSVRSALAYSLTDLGIAWRESGQPRKAVGPITEGLSLRDDLVRSDPKDWRAANLLAASRYHLGLAFRAAGESTAAEPLLAKSLEMRRDLALRNSKNTGARAEVAEAASALADVRLAEKRPADALALYTEARSIYQQLVSQGSLSREIGHEPARVAEAIRTLSSGGTFVSTR